MQFFGQEYIPKLSKSTNDVLSLAGGTNARVGGRVATALSALTLNRTVLGFGGIEVAVANLTFYYVYLVHNGTTFGLIASTSAVSPTGFTSYRKVGAFYTDSTGLVFKAYFFDEILKSTYTCNFTDIGNTFGEDVDWINGNFIVSGTSIFTGTIVAGIFAESPNAVVTVNNNTGGTIINSWMVNTTISTIVVKTFRAGAVFPEACYLVCTKRGVDAVSPDWSL